MSRDKANPPHYYAKPDQRPRKKSEKTRKGRREANTAARQLMKKKAGGRQREGELAEAVKVMRQWNQRQESQ